MFCKTLSAICVYSACKESNNIADIWPLSNLSRKSRADSFPYWKSRVNEKKKNSLAFPEGYCLNHVKVLGKIRFGVCFCVNEMLVSGCAQYQHRMDTVPNGIFTNTHTHTHARTHTYLTIYGEKRLRSQVVLL